MKIEKKIYNFRVKDGAYSTMLKILEFPETTGSAIDNKICRPNITYDIVNTIRPEYQKIYSEDRVWQIEILDDTSREYLVLESLLEGLDNVIIKESE